jgi:hypothetical protein
MLVLQDLKYKQLVDEANRLNPNHKDFYLHLHLDRYPRPPSPSDIEVDL